MTGYPDSAASQEAGLLLAELLAGRAGSDPYPAYRRIRDLAPVLLTGEWDTRAYPVRRCHGRAAPP
jgi:hypothetical protein